MAKLSRIIRSTDPVSETEANVVFELLIPILETDPTVDDVVDTAADVIGRCKLSDDRPLAHVLDWWYFATTGRPSVNGGAHLLPDSLNGQVKRHMEAVVNLDVSLPAADLVGRATTASVTRRRTLRRVEVGPLRNRETVWGGLVVVQRADGRNSQETAG